MELIRKFYHQKDKSLFGNSKIINSSQYDFLYGKSILYLHFFITKIKPTFFILLRVEFIY